jgi:hypothetical protein
MAKSLKVKAFAHYDGSEYDFLCKELEDVLISYDRFTTVCEKQEDLFVN